MPPGMLESVLEIPFWLELVATLTGGLCGAMVAAREKYDLFGVVCIACITGVAGGIMRDVLLQDYGIYVFQKPSLIVTCAIAACIVFFFGKLVAYLDPAIDLCDNVSVALWAVIGAGKGIAAGLGVIPATIMGTLTAVGGGIMRDVCMNRVPSSFQAGTFYSIAAFFGALVYALLKDYDVPTNIAGLVCVALILLIRYVSVFFNLRTTVPSDHTDEVAHAVAAPFRFVRRHVRPGGPEAADEAAAEETTGEIARKRVAYEKLRAVWKSPGDTSPLPSASEWEAARLRKRDDARAVRERAERDSS